MSEPPLLSPHPESVEKLTLNEKKALSMRRTRAKKKGVEASNAPIGTRTDYTGWTGEEKRENEKKLAKARQQKHRLKQKEKINSRKVLPKSDPRPLREQPLNRGVRCRPSSTGRPLSACNRRHDCEPTMDDDKDDDDSYDDSFVAPPHIQRVVSTLEPDENFLPQQQRSNANAMTQGTSQQNCRFPSSATHPKDQSGSFCHHHHDQYTNSAEPDGTDAEEYFDAAENENEYGSHPGPSSPSRPAQRVPSQTIQPKTAPRSHRTPQSNPRRMMQRSASCGRGGSRRMMQRSASCRISESDYCGATYPHNLDPHTTPGPPPPVQSPERPLSAVHPRVDPETDSTIMALREEMKELRAELKQCREDERNADQESKSFYQGEIVALRNQMEKTNARIDQRLHNMQATQREQLAAQTAERLTRGVENISFDFACTMNSTRLDTMPPPQTGERKRQLAPSRKSLSGPSDQQPYRGDGFDPPLPENESAGESNWEEYAESPDDYGDDNNDAFRNNCTGEEYRESRFGPTTTALPENRRAHEFNRFDSKGVNGDSSEDDDDDDDDNSGVWGSEPFQGTGSGDDGAGDDHNSAFGGPVQFQHTDSGHYGYVSHTEDEYGDTNRPNKSPESSGGGNNNNNTFLKPSAQKQKQPPHLAHTKKSAVARRPRKAAASESTQAVTTDGIPSVKSSLRLRPASMTKGGGLRPAATKAATKNGEPPIAASRRHPARPSTKAMSKKATQAASSAWKPKGGAKVMIVKPNHKGYGCVGTVVLQEPPSWKFRVDYTMPDGTAASSSFNNIENLAPMPSRGRTSRGTSSVETDSVAEEATVTVAEKETDSVAFAVAAEETVAVEEEELDEDADAPALVEDSKPSVVNGSLTVFPDIDGTFDALTLATNAVELEFNSLQSNGDIVMTNLGTAQGGDSSNGCALISVYTVHHLLHTSGAISNSDMTTCIETAGRTLQKIRVEQAHLGEAEAHRRGEDDCPEEDLMTIDDASDLFNYYEQPKKLANVVAVGGNIFWGEHLNNLVTTLLKSDEAAAAVFIKGHFVTLSKFRTDSDTFAYDLLDPLPSHGSEVGTRIRCYSLDALKVAMMQYTQWSLTEDEYRKARTTKWEDEFLYEEWNSAADKRIFQAHIWVSENEND